MKFCHHCDAWITNKIAHQQQNQHHWLYSELPTDYSDAEAYEKDAKIFARQEEAELKEA